MSSGKLLVTLSPDLRVDLDAFCEANLGAPAVRIVREALREYIDSRIEAEPALRERYQKARQQIVGPPTEIRLVGSRKRPG